MGIHGTLGVTATEISILNVTAAITVILGTMIVEEVTIPLTEVVETGIAL